MHQLIDELNAVAFNISDAGHGIGRFSRGDCRYIGRGCSIRGRMQGCGRCPPAYIGGYPQSGFPHTMGCPMGGAPPGPPGGLPDNAAGSIPSYCSPTAPVMNRGYGPSGGYVPRAPREGTQANVQQQPHSNTVKRYANLNGCYSCGFAVAGGHTSMPCPTHLCKMSHHIGFNCQNAQQYIDLGHLCSTRIRHKNQFPPPMSWLGAANDIVSKCINPFYVNFNLLCPTQLCMSS
jgi:hypothetical protein